MTFDFDFAIRAFPKILAGLPTTLLITVVAILFGLIFGFAIAFVRMHKIFILKDLAAFYVSMIRGTPLLVQIFIIYYGLTDFLVWLGMDYNEISPIVFALIAYTLNTCAYLSETIRSSLEVVDISQLEAAYSIGLTTFQGYRRIIIPQAFAISIPALGNTVIDLIKGTSLAFTITVADLFARAKIAAAVEYRYVESFVIALLIYLIVCMALSKFFFYLEKKINKERA